MVGSESAEIHKQGEQRNPHGPSGKATVSLVHEITLERVTFIILQTLKQGFLSLLAY